MPVAQLVFYIAALVFFVLAAVGINPRVNSVGAGLACWLTATVFIPLLS